MKSDQFFIAFLLVCTYVSCEEGQSVLVGTIVRCYVESAGRTGSIDRVAGMCRHRDIFLSCVKEGLPNTYKKNKLDFALSLNFDYNISRNHLESVCAMHDSIRNELNCDDDSENAVEFCQTILLNKYAELYEAYKAGNTPMEVLRKRSCKIAVQMGSCLYKARPSCSKKVRTFYIAYSKLGFTDKCVGIGGLANKAAKDEKTAKIARAAMMKAAASITSLSGMFVIWLFLCVMFSRVLSEP